MPYNSKTTKNQKSSYVSFETSSVNNNNNNNTKKENKPINLVDATNIESKKKSLQIEGVKYIINYYLGFIYACKYKTLNCPILTLVEIK